MNKNSIKWKTVQEILLAIVILPYMILICSYLIATIITGKSREIVEDDLDE